MVDRDFSTMGSNEGGKHEPLNRFMALHNPKMIDMTDSLAGQFDAGPNVEYNERNIGRHGFDAPDDNLVYDKVNPDVNEWEKIALKQVVDLLMKVLSRDSNQRAQNFSQVTDVQG